MSTWIAANRDSCSSTSRGCQQQNVTVLFPNWHRVCYRRTLHATFSSPPPTSTSASALADSLASFFTDKISQLCLSLANSSTSASPHSPSSPITFLTYPLLSLHVSEISKIYSTVLLTSNLTLTPSLAGLSKNALHCLSLLSPT